MDAIWTLSWRVYPAAGLVAAGVALVVAGLWRERRSLALPVTDPAKGGALVRSLRSVLTGLAVAGIGAAWVYHVPYLLGLCLIIGGEELLETSLVIGAMNEGERRASWDFGGRVSRNATTAARTSPAGA